MPLTTDPKVLGLCEDLLKQFAVIFGSHPGFRPVHAKGILLKGTFSGSAEGKALTRAPHVHRDAVPVVVRFSDTTGIPTIPDNDPNANPRGAAVRFYLAERVHTDIVMHSVNAFPAKTPQEFLEFLRAVGSGDPTQFLATHPAAMNFVQPIPVPSSFARNEYFGITAMKFTNKEGASKFGRFRLTPEAGVENLDGATAKGKTAEFLFDELKGRIAERAVKFDVVVQVANNGDVVNESTTIWPEDRKLVKLGKVELTATVPDDAQEQKHLIFDPLPRVEGIDPSDDPLLELRAALYLMSGRRRREAPEESVAGSKVAGA
jgi:catalase